MPFEALIHRPRDKRRPRKGWRLLFMGGWGKGGGRGRKGKVTSLLSFFLSPLTVGCGWVSWSTFQSTVERRSCYWRNDCQSAFKHCRKVADTKRLDCYSFHDHNFREHLIFFILCLALVTSTVIIILFYYYYYYGVNVRRQGSPLQQNLLFCAKTWSDHACNLVFTVFTQLKDYSPSLWSFFHFFSFFFWGLFLFNNGLKDNGLISLYYEG